MIHGLSCLNDSYIRAVHDSVLSLYLSCYIYFTAEQVDRKMKGYVYVKDNSYDIRRSIIFIDAKHESNARDYSFRETHFLDNLLHIHGLHSVFMNSQQVDAYEFLAEPVLYSYTRQKGQVISCDIDMLKFPKKLSATRNNIIFQRYLSYLIGRIEVTKNSIYIVR